MSLGNVLSYRPAAIEDLPEIVAIYNSTIAGRMVTADLEPVSVADKLAWYRAHNEAERPLWMIADGDGNTVGWVSFQSFYGRPAYRHTAEISIYLHERARGRGWGKAILQYAIEQCPRLEIKTLLGYIFAHNAPSLQLFRHFGFEQWAHLPGIALMDGVERSLIILGKRVY